MRSDHKTSSVLYIDFRLFIVCIKLEFIYWYDCSLLAKLCPQCHNCDQSLPDLDDVENYFKIIPPCNPTPGDKWRFFVLVDSPIPNVRYFTSSSRFCACVQYLKLIHFVRSWSGLGARWCFTCLQVNYPMMMKKASCEKRSLKMQWT